MTESAMDVQPTIGIAFGLMALFGLGFLVLLIVMSLLAIFKKWWPLLIISGGSLFAIFALIAVGAFISVKTEPRQATPVEAPITMTGRSASQLHAEFEARKMLTEEEYQRSVSIDLSTDKNQVAQADAEDDLGTDAVADKTQNTKKNEKKNNKPEPKEEPTKKETKELENPTEATTKEPTSSEKPEWVDRRYYEDNGVPHITVSSGPHAVESDCQRYLDEEIATKVNEYADLAIGEPFDISRLNLGKAFIKKSVIVDTYHAKVDTASFGEMPQWYAQLKFDSSFEQTINAKWAEVKLLDRVSFSGSLFGVLLLLLGCIYGLLKIYQSSEGKYAGRLQFAGIVAILSSMFCCVLLIQFFRMY